MSILNRQCLDRRIPDQTALRQEVEAWATRRNAAQATIAWQFTTADARRKLTKLYPTLDPTQ